MSEEPTEQNELFYPLTGFNLTPDEKINLRIAINSDKTKTKWILHDETGDIVLMISGAYLLRDADEQYKLLMALKNSSIKVSDPEDIVKKLTYKLYEMYYSKNKSNNNADIEEGDYPELDLAEVLKSQDKELNRRIDISSLPSDHFLFEYITMAKGLTDAYQEYHVVNGLWLLSAMCQNYKT